MTVARPVRPASEIVLTTCPRDCYDACGIAVVKRDGAIVSVRGDPAHEVSRGKLCAQVLDRLQRRLARSGGTGHDAARRIGPER